MLAYFDRFTIELTEEEARIGSHQGSCDEDVAYLVSLPHIRRQLDTIPDDVLARELEEYTDWDVSDREENEQRVIWIAAGNIRDEYDI